VKQSQEYFDFEIPSVLWTKRVSKFESKLTNTDNMFCKYLVQSGVFAYDLVSL